MKWMIASDIHGSEYYCRELMKAYKRERADRLLLLGDILYHGPRNDLPRDYQPKKVIELLNNYKQDIICVRGNCDTEVDQMVLKFPIMADYCVLADEEKVIYATHGHHFHEQNLPPLHTGDILLCGHTHVPKCTKHPNYIYMNPGSVSIPKEESWHGYMIYENGRFIWKDLEGREKMQYPKTTFVKKHIVTNIYEADYGCEGLKEGEKLKVIVELKDESNEKTRLQVEDEWLIQHKIGEGSKVILDASGNLKKVVEVVAAVIKGSGENAGKILATQRGYGEFQGGWEFPGGKIEKGETSKEALIREIREELEVAVLVEDFIDLVEYEYPEFYLSMECYWCRMESEDYVLKEHKASKWLTKETLKSVDWLPADVGLIDTLKERI